MDLSLLLLQTNSVISSTLQQLRLFMILPRDGLYFTLQSTYCLHYLSLDWRKTGHHWTVSTFL